MKSIWNIYCWRQVPLDKLCLVDEWYQSHTNYHKTYFTECWMKTQTQRTKHGCYKWRWQVPNGKVMLRSWLNQTNEKLHEAVVKRRRMLLTKPRINKWIQKKGTFAKVMLGRWMKSNISNYHKTYLDLIIKFWMDTKRTKHGCDEWRRQVPMEKVMLRRRKKPIKWIALSLKSQELEA